MPQVPLALNFAWDIVFAVIYPPAQTDVAGIIINVVWMICDIGIMITYFKYGYPYFKTRYHISRRGWISYSVFALIAAFGIMLAGGSFFGQFAKYFQDDIYHGGIFIAYI